MVFFRFRRPAAAFWNDIVKIRFFFRRSAPAQTKVKHKKAPKLSVKKRPGNLMIAGTDFKKPAVPPRLTSSDARSCIPTYAALCSRRVRAPSSILRNNIFLSGRPQKPIQYLHFLPHSHQRRFSVKTSGKIYLHFFNGLYCYQLYKSAFQICQWNCRICKKRVVFVFVFYSYNKSKV